MLVQGDYVKMNKKGGLQSTYNTVMLVTRLLFIIMVTLSVVMVIRSFLIVNIDTSAVEARVLTNRFLYSPTCLQYFNSNIYRGYGGTIDMGRFSSFTLDSCASYTENNFASAKLTLKFLDDGSTSEATYNLVGYEAWLPRVDIDGPGGSKYYVDKRLVLVKDIGGTRAAILHTEVVIPNY